LLNLRVGDCSLVSGLVDLRVANVGCSAHLDNWMLKVWWLRLLLRKFERQHNDDEEKKKGNLAAVDVCATYWHYLPSGLGPSFWYTS
jgi:hypothetical protein